MGGRSFVGNVNENDSNDDVYAPFRFLLLFVYLYPTLFCLYPTKL